MTGLLAIVAWLAVLDPPRTRLGLPESGSGRARLGIVGPGVVLGIGVLLVIAAAANSVLGALEITPEMFRIAAGFVLLIEAARMFFVAEPAQEPVAAGWRGAVWPVAYPWVVTPASIVLALTTGASDGVLWIPAVVAGAALVGLGATAPGPIGRRVLVALGRLLAVAVVLTAVWLAIAGVREV
jgi:small neutral amino acid transporter SnatA (MarC family)